MVSHRTRITFAAKEPIGAARRPVPIDRGGWYTRPRGALDWFGDWRQDASTRVREGSARRFTKQQPPTAEAVAGLTPLYGTEVPDSGG